MVQHNDKWKKKASREYHKKHGTQPAGRGRGRGAGITEEEAREEQIHDEADSEAEDSNDESGEEQETQPSRSKYARRKIESNAWRFEEEEPDPYLVIDQDDLEPPEPDYAHLPARPFQTKRQIQNSEQSSAGTGRGKKHTISEKELAPLKAQIDKANAAREFKERFGSTHKGNVLTVGEDGIARRRRIDQHSDQSDGGLEDIDTFLAELDQKKSSEQSTAGKSSQEKKNQKDTRPDLDSFVDSLI